MIWEFRISPIYHILDLGAAPQLHCWKRAGVPLLTALFSKPSCDWKKKAHPLVSGASVLTAGTVYFKWPIWRICIMQSRIGKKKLGNGIFRAAWAFAFPIFYILCPTYITPCWPCLIGKPLHQSQIFVTENNEKHNFIITLGWFTFLSVPDASLNFTLYSLHW